MKLFSSVVAFVFCSAPVMAGEFVAVETGGGGDEWIVPTMLTLLFIALFTSNGAGTTTSTKDAAESSEKGKVLMKF